MPDYYNDLDRALAYQSTYGNPQTPSQYSRTPVYSPFQNRHNIDDSFSYLANMYGPALVQAMAGPDAFLAHQAPGQALADQHQSSIYQRSVVHATSALTQHGNDIVAQKLLAIEAIKNGGLPPTQLDREQAQTGAGVYNNPLFKGFAASMIGGPRPHETVEDVMYGTKGDPTAIASAVGHMGFYRPDAMGGRQMSGESMRSFSTQLYDQLYGDNAKVEDMHGFGGHATGAMMQELFQQGQLPRSIGSLSAADRVRAISSAKRDDATMQSMVDDFAHNDLLQHDYDYANATAEERKVMLADKRDGYKTKLEGVFKEADKFRENDPRAKSAAEIEQLSGFSSAANGIDAQRTSKVVKDYAGAVNAIRELFGDNGKSNAPISELITALNGLTNGANATMTPAKMENMVRQIRLNAREAGMSDEQVLAVSNEMQRRGTMLGLPAETVMNQLNTAIAASNAMDDQGVHKPGWGKLSKADAERKNQELIQRGDRSYTGLSLAALNRLATENEKKYKGTELAAAAEAYRKGEETYTYDGKTVNLAQIAGQQGVSGVLDIARRSGADRDVVNAAFRDTDGTLRYEKAGYAKDAGVYQITQRLGTAHRQKLMSKANTKEFNDKFRPAGMTDEQWRKHKVALMAGISNKLGDIVVNETADMTPEERAETMERRLTEEYAAHFRSDKGGGLSEAAAEKRASEIMSELYGDTPEDRREAMNTAYAEFDIVAKQRTGMTIETVQQEYNSRARQQKNADLAVQEKHADRVKAMSSGTESNGIQRLSDNLEGLSSSDPMVRSEALKKITHVISTDEMLKKYAPEAQDALVHAGAMYNASTITEEKVKKLAEAAAENPDGPEQKRLMELAGYDKNHKLTEEEKASLVDKARMRSVGEADGTTDQERKINAARKQRADILFKAYNTGTADDVQAGAKALAQEMLGDRASEKDVQAFAVAALEEDPRAFERSIRHLPQEQQEAARSSASFLRVSRQIGGLESPGLAQNGQSVAEAANRPTAREAAFKSEVSRGIKDRMLPEINSREYKQLRKESFGDDTETGKIKGEAVVDKLSKILTDVVVEDMGGVENLTPEQRTKVMESKSKERLAAYFVENDEASPARAEQLAEQHFNALTSSDKDKRHEILDKIFLTTQEEAKRQGFDPESVAARREAKRAAMTAEEKASDATLVPASDGAAAVYDYKKLGVTEKVTPEQQQLIDNIKKNPSAAYIDSLVRDDTSKQLLLSLPDAAAVELFNQFSPEERAAGLQKMKQAATTSRGITNFPAEYGGPGYNFTQQDQQNFDRLHTALSKQQGVSSNNVMTPEQQQQAANRDAANGGTQQLPRAVQPATESALVQEQLSEIESRSTTNRYGRTFRTDADSQKHKDLTQRKNELDSGDPLSFVRKEMGEINDRKATSFWGNKVFASYEDNTRYKELEKREKAIVKDGGAVVQQQQSPSGVSAAQSTTNTSQPGNDRSRPQAESMKVNGTLTLNGLREAILAATGQRMEETPDGGAPVALGPPTGQ